MSDRFDRQADAWPLRPWIMAASCAAAGLVFHFLIYPGAVAPWRQAAATFVAIAAVSFVMTVEKRRWPWAVGFALGWGVVIALVGWFTARYNVRATIFEWPYLSGLLAVLLAAPLFQTIRDEGRRALPYERLHGHAWADGVIGAASLGFTGIVFLFSWLVAGLFDLIGIEAIKKLLEEDWFGWTLAGLAFGGSVGLLRENDRLLPMLQLLARIVLAVLAPPLAVALVLFIASIPFTGLEKFWKSGVPATPLLLAAGSVAILLANTIFAENPENRSPNPVLRWASLLLVAVVLPLAGIAAFSIGIRIEQYGWTPERIWGVLAVAIAVAYGLVGWYAIWRGRLSFDEPLRPLQTALAVGLCALALFLALPIVDFGSISARSQLARLESGKTKAEDFDWRAMAFDFGPAGRKRLQAIARSGPGERQRLAQEALEAKYPYDVASVETLQAAQKLDQTLRRIPENLVLPPKLRTAIAGEPICREQPCVVVQLSADRVLLVGRYSSANSVDTKVLAPDSNGAWVTEPTSLRGEVFKPDLATAKIELRPVERRQLFIDGRPVGDAAE